MVVYVTEVIVMSMMFVRKFVSARQVGR